MVGEDPFSREFGVDWLFAGVAAKGQTNQGGTEFSDLATFGIAVTAIMAVGAYWRCRSSLKECRTTYKFNPRVLEGGF